jgi:putative membrane protein
MLIRHRHYLLILAMLFGIWWVALAIHPLHRSDWLLENALALAAVVLLAVFHRRLLFSRVSYTLIFVFMCLHQVGAHYTYAEVPYDAWFSKLTGRTFNSLVGWDRNNFDRVVHFAYGLLLAYPVREVFLRVVNVRGFWGYFLPLDLTMSTSMLYELAEWGTARCSAATSARRISARRATSGTRTRTWRWPASARSSRWASPPPSTGGSSATSPASGLRVCG